MQATNNADKIKTGVQNTIPEHAYYLAIYFKQRFLAIKRRSNFISGNAEQKQTAM